MKIGQAFPSKYLKADDLMDKPIALAIDKVTIEDIDGKGKKKAVLYFRGKSKGLVLNVTNKNKIVRILGTDETDDWKGKTVVLFPSTTDFQGDEVPCIRIKDGGPLKGRPTARSVEPDPDPEGDPEAANYQADDDDVPF